MRSNGDGHPGADGSRPTAMDEAVRSIEDALGIRSGFLDRLVLLDDWSFVAQLYPFIDACMTLLITRQLADVALGDPISKINLNDQRRGKLAFVQTLDLLSDAHITFVRQVAEVRNRFVHHISQIDMTLGGYINELPLAHRETFLQSVAALLDKEAVLRTAGLEAVEFVRQYPRFGVHIGTLDLVARIHMRIAVIKRRDARRSIADLSLEKTLATIRTDPANLL
jgi:hypothetical protein